MPDGETVQSAWISYLKSLPQVTALLINGGADEIRETQWQGDVFRYPNIRVQVDYMPSILNCGPDDIDVFIEIFSEQKSSKEVAHIAAVLTGLLRRVQFSQNGLKFPMVEIEKIEHPVRDELAWKSVIKIKGLVN